MEISSRTPVQFAGLIIGPIIALLLLLFFKPQPETPQIGYMLAVVALMAIWWITEAIPLAATSLLPFVLFPSLGILSANEAASAYFNPIIFLFLGGFLIALAMERWNLHRRIALAIIDSVGRDPKWLVLGFMLASGFISMWISNTATAVMMLPIGLAILSKLNENFGEEKCSGINVCLMLGIAYGASIGGVATLVGTPPNLVFARIYAIAFPEEPAIAFGQWILLGVPFSLVLMVIVWLLMTRFIFRIDKDLQLSRETFREEREGLGRMSWEEKIIAVIFATTALLWVSRTDITIGSVTLPGWTRLWEPFLAIDDGTIAIAMALLLFMIPTRSGARGGAILDGSIFAKVPWGIVLLFGGGFALAKGFGTSGLAEWIAQKFTGAEDTSPFLTVVLVSTTVNALTELTSNTATAQMFLPLLASMAVGMGIHPLLLMIAATISASMTFMMPVATPPNAIVFGSGYIRIGDMVRVGIWINIVSIILAVLVVWFLVPLIFDISQMPVSALELID